MSIYTPETLTLKLPIRDAFLLDMFAKMCQVCLAQLPVWQKNEALLWAYEAPLAGALLCKSVAFFAKKCKKTRKILKKIAFSSIFF